MIQTADRLNSVQEYYFSRKLEEIRQMNAAGKDVINLGIGSPDLAPADSVVDALSASAHNKNSHGYQSYRSIEELRIAIADFYKTHFNVSLDPKTEILPLLGSKEGVMYISMAFLNPGDTVLIPNPGYPAYEAVAKMIEAKPARYNLLKDNNWAPDLKNIDPEVVKNARIMWVNYPNMPTGADGSKQIFQDLIDFGKENNILICNDNPYSFILNDAPKSILEQDENKEYCLELNSLSKAYNMAGWRVGMVSGNKDYINAILKVKSNVDSGMFKPVQEAAIVALSLSKEWIAENNVVYKRRKQIAQELLDIIGCTYNESQVGMFVWANNPEGRESEEFIDEILQKANVFITPGTIFGSNGEGFVRVSLCSTEEKFRESIDRIKKAQIS
ncbi:aminotransferase class I/II-fold pyridoxal phosphate-dependent enzyme [Reichenbachiella sp. MALMAid0571]|uniref:aminotransferase class I/II-fold pyridoxal phosphate-dependent enzyme n=1 Tax=Reichenbachiella sp. MALMAid0571 TaxID=3143939 RepID=UPI0032DE81A6